MLGQLFYQLRVGLLDIGMGAAFQWSCCFLWSYILGSWKVVFLLRIESQCNCVYLLLRDKHPKTHSTWAHTPPHMHMYHLHMHPHIPLTRTPTLHIYKHCLHTPPTHTHINRHTYPWGYLYPLCISSTSSMGPYIYLCSHLPLIFTLLLTFLADSYFLFETQNRHLMQQAPPSDLQPTASLSLLHLPYHVSILPFGSVSPVRFQFPWRPNLS